jgi:glycosyltransferase involved in cell wall biosynthesis
MKLALLKGNRFNPWHLLAFNQLRGNPEIVAFRAESEIQRYYAEQGADTLRFPVERIYFDTQAGPWPRRIWNQVTTRYRNREPHMLPFHERLKGFNLIHTWELFPDWSREALEARRRWDIPVCAMVWDNIPFNMERDPARRALKEQVAREADRFIVHTVRSLRTLVVEGVDEKRIVKMDHGVDTEKFSPGPRQRAQFGLDDDAFVILFVGWLLPRKGIDFLLLAMRELKHDPVLGKRPVKLVCIGSGPGRDRVEELVKRLDIEDRCTFTGSLPYDAMPDAFRAADVFVLPSIATPEWQEQFGMALIEAMACGVPVITTYSGAIPEVVEDAAVLCQPNDFVSIYDALKALMLDPARCAELAARGRARAEARFTLAQYANALSDVYAELT